MDTRVWIQSVGSKYLYTVEIMDSGGWKIYDCGYENTRLEAFLTSVTILKVMEYLQ